MDPMLSLAHVVKELKGYTQCPICLDILIDPISTTCNHHFCAACHKKLFRSCGRQKCPVCNASLTRRSCSKNSISLKPIVQTVKSLIDSLLDDTGIDFSNEYSAPVSTREAVCDASILHGTLKSAKNVPVISNQQKEKNLGSPCSRQESKVLSLRSNNKEGEVKTNRKILLDRKSKVAKQYQGRKEIIGPEDSFLFAADFIVPKRKTVEPSKKIDGMAASSKVSTWLQENEENLNDCENMSILNGSLPKKISPELNVSFSDDELLSVSQVNTNCKTFLPPKKISVENIAEENEKQNQPEFKDPYEFISSQKSNLGKKPIKRTKCGRISYGNKKKPLGLDISRLANETYTKKKRKLNDTSIFHAAHAINDTFDQLMANVKNKQTSTSNSKEGKANAEIVQESGDNEIFIFQSQNNVNSSQSDFSSGSDEEWGQTRQEKLRQSVRRRSDQVFKAKASTNKRKRKSESCLNSIKLKEDNFVQSLNETFQEVENHELVTSSQVAREQLLPKDNLLREAEDLAIGNMECNFDVEKCEADALKNNHSNLKNNDVQYSPGWSSVNQLKLQTGSSKRKTKTHNLSVETKKTKICPENSMGSKLIDMMNHSKINAESFKADTVEDNDKSFLSREQSLCVEKSSSKKQEYSERLLQGEEMHSSVRNMRNCSSSPEEPVRYLNVSQSTERAKIMNEVVKSLELSLMNNVCPQESNINVSIEDLPDKSEIEIISDCSNNLHNNNNNNSSPLGKLNLTCTESSVPFTITMSSEVEKAEERTNDTGEVSSEKTCYKDTAGVVPVAMNNPIVNQEPQDPSVSEAINHKSSFSEGHILRNSDSDLANNMQLHFQDLHEDSYESNRICLSDKSNPVKPNKGILIRTTNAMKCNSENHSQFSPLKLRKNSDEVVRKVHFKELSVSDKSEQMAEGGLCVFLKAGKLLDHKPRVKFSFRGSCMTKLERSSEVCWWIIKVSKSCPPCCAGHVNSTGLSVEPPCESSLENFSIVNKNLTSQFHPDVLELQKQLTNIQQCNSSCNENLKSLQDVLESKLEDGSTVHNEPQKPNQAEEKFISDTVNEDTGVKNADVNKNLPQVNKCIPDKDTESQRNVSGKSSDEDIFQSAPKTEELISSQDDYNQHKSSSSEKLYEMLPPNMERQPCSNRCPTDEDIFQTCLNDNNSLEDKDVCSSVTRNVLLGSSSISTKENQFNVDDNFELDKDKLSATEKQDDRITKNISNTNSCSIKSSVEENLKIDQNSNGALKNNLSLVEVLKSPEFEDVENIFDDRPSTADDIFATGPNNSPCEKISLSDATPELSQRYRKRLRPLDESSDESSSSDNPLKHACPKQFIIETKQNIDSPKAVKASKQKSKNIQYTQDDDDLLNSEELLQKVMDNMNKEIGNCPSVDRQLKGARKVISSDSEDDYTEDLNLIPQNLSKSPEYELPKEDDLEDDIFKDDEGANEVDIIDSSPVKKKLDGEQLKQLKAKTTTKTTESKNLRMSNTRKLEIQTQDSASKKFILPHSSCSKKKLKLTPKSSSVSDHLELEEKKQNKCESDKVGSTCNLFGSLSAVNLSNVEKNIQKEKAGSSSRNEIILKNNEVESIETNTSVPKNINRKKKLLFGCSGLTEKHTAMVKKFARKIGAGFSDNFSIAMTHLIVNVDENRKTNQTLKFLQAVAHKKWIVCLDWVLACASAKTLVPEDDFEVLDNLGTEGPRRSRLSSDSLFKDVQACFIGPFVSISIAKFQDLFMMCGGMVVDSPEGFSVSNNDILRIIVSDMDSQDCQSLCDEWLSKYRAVAVTSDWVVDSIQGFSVSSLRPSFIAFYSNEKLQTCGINEKYLKDVAVTVCSGLNESSSQSD